MGYRGDQYPEGQSGWPHVQSGVQSNVRQPGMQSNAGPGNPQWQPPGQPPRPSAQWGPPPGQQVQPYQQQWQQQPYRQHAPVAIAPRNPAVAALLGLLIPGLGCMTSGRPGLGVIILACWLLSLVLLIVTIGIVLVPACWIWSGVAGYMTAQRWNRDHGIIS